MAPMFTPRCNFGIEVVDDLLFVVGGFDGFKSTTKVECYDAETGSWYRGDIPCAYHGVVYLKGFVYYIGGCYNGTCLNTVSKFNPITRTWHQVAPMLSRRCEVSVATLDGYIYAMGGFDGHGDLKTAERYDPETNKWSLIKPMNETARHGLGVIAFNDKIYAVSDYSLSQRTSDVWEQIPKRSFRRTKFRDLYYSCHVIC
uniref:Uncharacterized protein n=1 Tax=Paramormyrops kingsleyae TaxID=1676925 RepID=A0A3B3SMU1_9TELE